MPTGNGTEAFIDAGDIAAAAATARSGADVDFDLGDRDSCTAALKDIERVCVLDPILRTDFADDDAEVAGVAYVTFLSAYGIGARTGRGRRPQRRTRPATSRRASLQGEVRDSSARHFLATRGTCRRSRRRRRAALVVVAMTRPHTASVR